MSDHAIAASGHDQHEDPMSHVPPPSFWPLFVGIGLTIGGSAFVGYILMSGKGTDPRWEERLTWFDRVLTSVPPGVLGIVAGLMVLFTFMGWAHQVIVEKKLSHSLLGQQADLKMFIKLFLLSEFTAFGAIFGYFYVRRFLTENFHAPEGIHLGGPLAAVATFLLLSSSVTCEFAHHALAHGQFQRARLLLLGTMLLGAIFLGLQGYEYGELITHGFWPGVMQNDIANTFATVFFVGTGFHGLHVLTGLVLLFLVYMRLEMDHFTPQRHFSFIAASWYWHFVDIVWVLLFITVYVV